MGKQICIRYRNGMLEIWSAGMRLNLMWIPNKPWQATSPFPFFLYYKPNDNTVLWPHLLQTGWHKSQGELFFFFLIFKIFIKKIKKEMKQGEKILKNLFSSTNKCLTECYDMERAARSTRVDFPDLCQARGWREEQPLLCRQTFRETARHSVEGWCEKPIRDRGCHLLAVPFLVELFGQFFFFF